jgi:PAS domain S-box-containing protein
MADKKEQLKKLLERLHKGENLEHIRDEFAELIEDISPADISAVEEQMVKGGMPQQEIHKLCDVHMAVFKEKLESSAPLSPAGHPVHILMEEHKVILGLANELRDLAAEVGNKRLSVGDITTRLIDISHHFKDSEKHYVREENVLFPYLEKHGVTQPPAVMWMEHGMIRETEKKYQSFVEKAGTFTGDDFIAQIDTLSLSLLELLSNHFYKENNILFPTSLQVIPENEWPEIRQQFDELGYCCFTPDTAIKSTQEETGTKIPGKSEGKMNFETGSLTPMEIEAIFNNLPVDITFVGNDDTVRYFSQTKDRIFPRAKAIIGRTVQNCHPQKSVDKVSQIVSDFKSKKRDTAEFWINMQGKMIYIRYFAVRDSKGEYLGTMEITQDITEIQKIKGEKRLTD